MKRVLIILTLLTVCSRVVLRADEAKFKTSTKLKLADNDPTPKRYELTARASQIDSRTCRRRLKMVALVG